MICLPVTEEIDVCIGIETKVIFKKKATGELAEEVCRQDTKLRAEHIARQFEVEIVEKVRKQLAEELDPTNA
jgi:hypothetical protein